jgi:hypothetical protein
MPEQFQDKGGRNGKKNKKKDPTPNQKCVRHHLAQLQLESSKSSKKNTK